MTRIGSRPPPPPGPRPCTGDGDQVTEITANEAREGAPSRRDPEPGWSLVYEAYDPAHEGTREALCALGNGYFVSRGAAPECAADGVHYPGTYLAGGYNRLRTEIAGREVENEDLVNLPNWLPLAVRIDDGEWLSPDTTPILDYRQRLDLRAGVLYRTIRYRDAAGRTTRWEEERLVSMADPHCAGLRVTVTPEDWSGRITVRSALDGGVINDGVERYRALNSRHLSTIATGEPDGLTLLLHSRTVQSHLEVAMAARCRLRLDGSPINPPRSTEHHTDRVHQDIHVGVTAGRALEVEKLVTLHGSRDVAISEPSLAARERLEAIDGGFEALLDAHRRAWRHLWEECDLEVDSTEDGAVRWKLRLHLFHLLQTVSLHSLDHDVGVPARGWHGEAYRGHVFWDELFIIPALSFRLPSLSRALLLYRCRRLPAARRAAAAAGHRGAMFPWQSGSTGREETQKLHLNPRSGRWLPDNSHRQRHVQAAIAYNLWHYVEVTADYEFLYSHGAELMVEMARFWASIATFDQELDRYHIRGVMGPDEFHTAYPGKDPTTEGGLDNNAYTNVMAAWTLMRALDVLDLLPVERRRALCDTLALDARELETWDEVSRKLRVPMHGDGLVSQFEGYEALEELDWEAARERHGHLQRLDRILEAQGDDPNRYKASKQADVLMLFYLFSAEELEQIFERLGYRFDARRIRDHIDYYLARTTHGSTLSWVVHSWVLARSERGRAWELFCRALDSDVGDIQDGTTREGIHLGAMAGTTDLLQRCFTGLEPRANVLHFNPCLPTPLERLRMQLRYRGQSLTVEVDRDWLRIRSGRARATPITVAYRGQCRELSPGQRCRFRLIRPEDRDRDENRRGDGDRAATRPVMRSTRPEDRKGE